MPSLGRRSSSKPLIFVLPQENGEPKFYKVDPENIHIIRAMAEKLNVPEDVRRSSQSLPTASMSSITSEMITDSGNQRFQLTVQLTIYIIFQFFFFKNSFLRTHVLVLGLLLPLFLFSGEVSFGFQSQSGLDYSHCGGKRDVHSPRSSCGATLADILAAGVHPVLSTHNSVLFKCSNNDIYLYLHLDC